MSTAALVVCGPELLATARAWAADGLLGESLWLEREGLGRGLGRAEWQLATAAWLPSPERAAPVGLQDALAALDGLARVSVAWVRPAAAAEDAAGMASIAGFLRTVINRRIAVRWLDVVVPTSLEASDLPPGVPGWRQVLVAPEDRHDPAAADAGWVARAEAITLHSVAALVGRLGGEHEPPPPPPAVGVEVVTTISRHVLGGERARLRAEHYLDHSLPRFSALDVSPPQHEHFREPWDEVQRATAWLVGAADGALEHATPTPVDPQRDAVAGLLPQEIVLEPSSRPWRRALVEFFTGRDPYEEAAQAPDDPTQPAPHPRVWEQRSLAETDRVLTLEAGNPGVIPDSGVWRSFVGLATGLVDGGELPRGYPPVIVHERRAVVPPEFVGPAGYVPGHAWASELEEALPELEHGASPVVAGRAVADARARLDTLGPPVLPDEDRGAVAELAAHLTREDASWRTAQAEGLDALGLEADPEPAPFVDRVHQGVLGHAIGARLDGRRWHRLATDPWPEPRWRTGRVRAGTGVLAGIAAAGSLVWAIFGEPINQWLTDVGAAPLDDPVVYGVMAAILLVSLVIGYVLTLRIIHERDRYWRWRRRVRRGLAAGALGHYADASRLGNALRILGFWQLILGGLLPPRDGMPDVPDAVPAAPLPVGLAWSHPRLHRPYEELVVHRAGAQPGYRSSIAAQVARAILDEYGGATRGDALSTLTRDTGYTEGALHRVARDLWSGGWDAWRTGEIDRITSSVKRAIAVARTPVGPAADDTIESFVAETAEKPGFLPGYGFVPDGIPEPRVLVHRWSSLGGGVVTNQAVFATAGVVVTRFQAPWGAAAEAPVADDAVIDQ